MAFATLIDSKVHLIPGKLKVSELLFEVPEDYSHPDNGTIKIFARAVTRREEPAAGLTEEERRKQSKKPWFVYLQGGPGAGCPPPQDAPLTQTVLDRGYQMLYLDQRGTGLSSPITADTLALQGDVYRQVDYLKLFRADNIVRDCECIRKLLTEDYPLELKKWTIFGQSFGGFCVLTYLSFFPRGVKEAFTTGGLAPIGKKPTDVYVATFRKVAERNEAFYKKFPEDVATVQDIVSHIRNRGGLTLPSGGLLTVRGFLTLGRAFGMHGGLDTVHDLILRMRLDLIQFEFITRPTLSALESALTFDNGVLYAVLHEAIYCEDMASDWAALRVGKGLTEFQWLSGSERSTAPNGLLFFSGEMIFPFFFEIFPELKRLADVADRIAKYTRWPELYDPEQLLRNNVPLYAATFIDDMYVDFGYAQDTARLVQNCKQYITNAMYHNALRASTDDILKELFKLRDDTID